MGSRMKPCNFCDHDYKDYPFGKFCITHHDHCESKDINMTQSTSGMVHQAWHRLEACVRRLKDDEKDGKLWLLSWQVAGSLRTIDYLPNIGRRKRGRKPKPESLYHKVYIAGQTGATKKIELRRQQEVKKLADVLETIKKLQEPHPEFVNRMKEKRKLKVASVAA